MTADEFLSYYPTYPQPKIYIRLACRYLQDNGFRFLVDFGFDNAIDKARAHWKARPRLR